MRLLALTKGGNHKPEEMEYSITKNTKAHQGCIDLSYNP